MLIRTLNMDAHSAVSMKPPHSQVAVQPSSERLGSKLCLWWPVAICVNLPSTLGLGILHWPFGSLAPSH